MSQRLLRLEKSFYESDTCTVAQSLLGKLLVRELPNRDRLSGIIVEVEAYLSENDPACHSYRGLGKKNASMFAAPGTLYVYPIHAKHCLNVVTEPIGAGAAVLIRALQPWEGITTMGQLRGCNDPQRLTTGPSRLCQALQIDRSHDGTDLIAGTTIWIEPLEQSPETQIHKSTSMPTEFGKSWSHKTSQRIGISQAVDLQLRWFIDGNRFVSGCARDHSQGRYWHFVNKS